ncbi:MAG TPA: hypothetical protein VGE12_12335 [Noviherbaspirillum sp.]
MKSLKSTSKILLVVAALSLTAVGCERRAGDQTSGASGSPDSSSSSGAGMGSSGASGTSSGATGSGGTGSGSGTK